MAIDTALKRRSVSGISVRRRPAVTPNVAKPAEWRQQVAGVYAGIATSSPVVVIASGLRTFFASSIGRSYISNASSGRTFLAS